MGAKGSKQSRPKLESKALVLGSKFSIRKPSIIEAFKPQCLRKRQTKERIIRVSQLPQGRIAKLSKLTLEDWLFASPGNHLESKDYLHGGELHVFKHLSSKVHPSPSREVAVDGDSRSFDLSASRSLSGKSTKKVSFRLPEEADVRIFYSSPYGDSAD